MLLVVLLATFLVTSLAFAAVSRTNAGFENGLTGWNSSGSVSVVSSFAGYTAPYGSNFARLATACYTSTLSQNFTGAAGEMISGQAAFYGGDYLPYNDSGMVRIMQGNVVLFYADIAAVGNFGQTPWTAWSYTLPASGTYTLEARASNAYDCAVTSYLLIDSPHNNPPTADAGGPYLAAVGEASIPSLDGSGSSDPDGDLLTETWTADGGTVAGDIFTAGSEAGIFDVCLTVNDGTVDSDEDCTIVVVYDPSAGFVTGGGWIDSPAGAYMDDETLSGKATFGFVSKYKKGATVPTGNTEFQFRAASFNFHSSSYEWLVVNQNGENAQFRGEGTVNGELDSNGNAYKFMIWAGDSDSDTFRIKIWSELNDVETDVYDNGVDQEIGGGSIVIHTKK
jgi:hypothetical protein